MDTDEMLGFLLLLTNHIFISRNEDTNFIFYLSYFIKFVDSNPI